MVFLRDEGGEFDAPIEAVWEFVSSGDPHSSAHRHRQVRRRRHSALSATYSWIQEFRGKPTRFAMRWTSFWPVGVAYRVRAGPFRGSTFFLTYEPRGSRTGVSIVGEFVSTSLGGAELRAAVRQFFDTEYRQDGAALRAWVRNRGRAGR